MPRLKITSSGQVVSIYSETWLPLYGEGEACITRASHVEPIPNSTQWEADLSPSGGPKLGPFTTRQMAIDAEIQWLEENIL